MSQVTTEELLKRCGSIYKLVILAARRAKEIAEGAPALVEGGSKKATSIALEEILQGKVLYKPEEPAEGTSKKKRAARSKERKQTT